MTLWSEGAMASPVRHPALDGGVPQQQVVNGDGREPAYDPFR
ncbi:MAG: hypothetical protein ACRD82_07555 [Blastocatellia bacterium]